MKQTWSIPTRDDNHMGAYVALPAQTPAPVLIVIQEIFGVNAETRARCDAYAAEGYIAIAPDLFWRLERDVDLTDRTEEEWAKAFDLMTRFNVDQGVEDLADTLSYARNRDECDGFVANVGFCLGGKLAFLMAARTDVDASIAYYGVGIEGLLAEMDSIKKPLLLHIAGQDKFVPPAAQQQIIDKATGYDRIVTCLYMEQDHAFSRKGGDHYDEAASALAADRTAAFLNKARAAS